MTWQQFLTEKMGECWHELLRIPKPIGWQNPERGLWGMILGTKELSENWSCCLLKITTEHHQRTYSTDCPFTALLKALCEQCGV